MATTVHVKGIAADTGDKEIKDFFSFCGKISNIQIKPAGEGKEADVTFEKETAAKTALLLNNSQLGKQSITVTSASGDAEDDGSHFKSNDQRDSDEITQEEKPRSRIIAEYLAHGYVIGDAAVQRAVDLDAKHGVSSRFLATLQNLDQKYHATDKARATDQSYGITAKAGNLLSGIGSYFEKASNTPTGQRIVHFYTEGSRQVADVHNEARRLAELKKQAHGGSAYKAAGLERVFGKEEAKPEGETTASTTSTAAAPAAPATGTTSAVPDTNAPKV